MTDFEKVVAAFRETGSAKGAARLTGVPRTTVRRMLVKAVSQGLVAAQIASPDPEPIRPAEPKPAADDRERVRLTVAEQRARDAERRLRQQDLADAEREQVLEMIGALVDRPAGAPRWVIEPRPAGKGKSIPVALLSDWHLGETVNPREIHGVNRFNVAVARARVRELVERIVHLSRHYMGQQEFPGIVACLLGDFVSGELHAELEATDELSVLQSIPEAVDLLEWALSTLADAFGRVYAPAVCGNHGRIFDKRPRAKGYVHRNADWLIYALLAKRFQGDDRVTIEFDESNEVFFEVFGTRFLVAHGDHLGVKGGDGIIGSLGPIMRGALKVGKYSRSIGREFDHLLIGHWHQSLWLPGVIVNGALKGWDEYASRFLKAPAGPPQQSLFFVHADRGITTRFEITLGEQDPPADPAPAARRGAWLSAA